MLDDAQHGITIMESYEVLSRRRGREMPSAWIALFQRRPPIGISQHPHPFIDDPLERPVAGVVHFALVPGYVLPRDLARPHVSVAEIGQLEGMPQVGHGVPASLRYSRALVVSRLPEACPVAE